MDQKMLFRMAVVFSLLTGCSSETGPLFPFSESGTLFLQRGEPMVMLDAASAESWRGLDINLHPPGTELQDYWRAQQAVAEGRVNSLESDGAMAIVFPAAEYLTWVDDSEALRLVAFKVCPNVNVDTLLSAVCADAAAGDVEPLSWIAASDECVLIHATSSLHDANPRAFHLRIRSGEYQISTRMYNSTDGTVIAYVYDIVRRDDDVEGE